MRAWLLAGVAMLGWTDGAHANLISNGDFESGSLDGFIVTNTNGDAGTSYGLPAVATFNVVNGQPSKAAEFNVGTSRVITAGGAIISQTITTAAGLLSLSFDLASFNSATVGNVDGGTYGLMLDGTTLNSFSVGSLASSAVVRDSLAASTSVSAGQHTFAISITRIYTNGNDSDFGATPYEYIDNLDAAMAVTDVPEPASLALLGMGVAGIAAVRRRRAG